MWAPPPTHIIGTTTPCNVTVAGVRASGGGFLTRREHTHNIHFSTGPINTSKRTTEARTTNKKINIQNNG